MASFKAFQKNGRKTWLSHKSKDAELAHIGLGIAEESGEVCSLLKRVFRQDLWGCLDFRQNLSKEIGDVLYYLARLADYYDLDLEEIAEDNHKKLMDRMKRGMLKGNGDAR